FDDGIQDFVDIGDTSLPATARFAVGAKQNTVHGNNVWKNVFDTWHPGMDTGTDDDPVYPMLSDPTVLEYLPQTPVYDIANQSLVPRASPLSAIRILIRYEDPTSGQVRQMTLIHPLRNKSDE
ncbi:MAG: hypothetical protein KDA74_12240, partial [Planctomycetaceae bacterium]|nr:hypothetical protein [Planctomycetaceae bacterium]